MKISPVGKIFLVVFTLFTLGFNGIARAGAYFLVALGLVLVLLYMGLFVASIVLQP